MRSIALYVHYTENQNDGQREESQSVDKSISEELHINIWKVQQGHLLLQPKLYIDFGIMTTFQTDQLCLYLPFRIVGTPTDLGQILQNNREMLCTVFNENLLSETQPNNCYSSVKKSSSTNECPLFYLFQLGSENMRVQEQKEGALQGTYIFIVRNGGYDNRETHDKDDWNKKVYIRFRVAVKDIKEIVYSEFVSNDLFQAAFSKVDLYDIRINETREIHPKVAERMSLEHYKLCKFSKIHLFYMADSREKVENGSSLKSDSRILEEGRWIQYEPQNNLRNAIFLAHHWKKRVEESAQGTQSVAVDSFSLFFSTIYPHIHWLHLMAFLSVIIVLGWIGGMLEVDFQQVNGENWRSWVKPVIVGVLILFIVVYALALNYGYKGHIYRKR